MLLLLTSLMPLDQDPAEVQWLINCYNKAEIIKALQDYVIITLQH